MVYHASDLFHYVSTGTKENLAEWQVNFGKNDTSEVKLKEYVGSSRESTAL